ncbi:hypothetical protein QM012_003413 [Aureobasidium pullulans]|uniref:Uncharacterized protein n=1 Tax=Aureobasidium pullulans TaxID=5580 RepID=A0ABR0T8B9_AURPU
MTALDRIKISVESLEQQTEAAGARMQELEAKLKQDTVNIKLENEDPKVKDEMGDFEIKAMSARSASSKKYQLYHKAVKLMEELRSGEIDHCVEAIYCNGHDWLTECISRWEEENKKAEGEIRKLEWQMKN